ncbi:MAG TPA: acyl-CoA dehydrogenase family protein, partial [Planctomycetia bacterium]|nr:acyl-CoA dehydrogenase family protein [Planctomycetia bacterium]
MSQTDGDSRIDEESLAALAAGAERADRSTDWPAALTSISRPPRAAIPIPKEFGGEELAPVALLEFDEAVAASCATVALILSQRAAAIRLLLRASPAIKERWLPPLASGEAFATVGLAQITTSRQHGASALLATPRNGGGFRLDGAIPWVTGADRADVLVIGATLEDGRQIVTTLPTDRRGIAIGPPLALSALAGSRTASVKCEGVEIAAGEIILGPTGKVLGG